jgi:hypothetical protein
MMLEEYRYRFLLSTTAVIEYREDLRTFKKQLPVLDTAKGFNGPHQEIGGK